MFAKNNQISGRQAARLIFFDLLGYSALLVPAALAGTAGNDGIISIGLGILAGFFYLWFLKKLIGQMKGTYSQCVTEVCGPVMGNVIKIGYLIYFLPLAGRVAAVFAELVVQELLERQFRLILVIILLLVYYGVSGGIEGRARVYEILFWILLLPLFLMMLLATPAVDIDYWLPVAMEAPSAILQGGYQVFLCVSILFLVPFLAEYVGEKEKVCHSARRALCWTGGILGALYLLLLGMFGKDALSTLDYPAVTMMSRIQMTGGFFKRTDAFMFGIWFFTLYALLCSLIFFAGRLWPRGEKGNRIWLLGEILVTFLLANGFYYSDVMKSYFEKFYRYVGTPFVVLVPLVLYGMLRKRPGPVKMEGGGNCAEN